MTKSTKIIAGLGAVAALGVAIAPASFAAVVDGKDYRKVTDTLNVTIAETCSVSATYATGATGNQWGTKAEDSYGTGDAALNSIANTWTLAIANNATASSPSNTMAITCNHSTGWNITAQNSAALVSGTDTIDYNTSAAAGTEGWYVSLAATGATLDGTNVVDGKMNDLNTAAAIVANQASSTSTSTVTATYTVGTSTITEAGTYTGNVVYTLAANA